MDFNSPQMAELELMLSALKPEKFETFTNEEMVVLADKFKIKADSVTSVQVLLEIAASIHGIALQSNGDTNKEVRRQLNLLASASKKLVERVEGLNEHALRTLTKFQFAKSLQNACPNDLEVVTKNIPEVFSEIFDEQGSVNGSIALFDFEALTTLLTSIENDAKEAQKLAIIDPALQDFLLLVRLVWTAVLQRDFTLAWNGTESAYSEASHFCYDVAKVIDDSIEVSSLDYASREIQGKANDPKSLSDLSNFLDQMLNHLR